MSSHDRSVPLGEWLRVVFTYWLAKRRGERALRRARRARK